MSDTANTLNNYYLPSQGNHAMLKCQNAVELFSATQFKIDIACRS